MPLLEPLAFGVNSKDGNTYGECEIEALNVVLLPLSACFWFWQLINLQEICLRLCISMMLHAIYENVSFVDGCHLQIYIEILDVDMWHLEYPCISLASSPHLKV